MNNPYSAPSADLSIPEDASAPYQPRYFAMRGRLGRVRYIAYSMSATMGLAFVLSFFVGIIGAVLRSPEAVTIMMVLIYIPIIAVSLIYARRRVHDMGFSGWVALVSIIPVVNFWLLFHPGPKGENKYGPPPVPNTAGVIVAAVLPFIFMIGILAAVAIPAYQGYVQKARQASEQMAAPPADSSASE